MQTVNIKTKPANILPYDILPKEINSNIYSCKELKHDNPHNIVAFNLHLYYPLYLHSQTLNEPQRWVYQWQFGQFRYKMHMIENHFYIECYCRKFLKNKKLINFLQPSKNMTYVAFGFKDGFLWMFLRSQSHLAPMFVEVQIPSIRYEVLPSAVLPIFNQSLNWELFGGSENQFKMKQQITKLIN